MSKFQTMNDVRRANKEHGHHFFEASSLRFFDSYIGRELIHGRYFVTSEQFHGSTHTAPRLYTVRRVEDDGSITDASTFKQFTTGAQAKRYALRLLLHPTPCANCHRDTLNPNFTCNECQREAQA